MQLLKNKKLLIFISFILVVIIGLIVYLFTRKNVENMTNTLDSSQANLNLIDGIVRNIYANDMARLRNLDATINDLQTQIRNGKVSIPANIETTTGAFVIPNNVNLSAHPTGHDGAFYRFGGQAYIAADDMLYFRSVWNTNAEKINFNLDTGRATFSGPVDILGSFNIIPRGIIVAWTGATAPAGWALCDGTNNTPDLRGRFILGMGQGANLSNRPKDQTGGAETVRLTEGQMPRHSHGYNLRSALVANRDSGRHASHYALEDRSATTSSTGDNQPHENMPPFYVLAYIMKL